MDDMKLLKAVEIINGETSIPVLGICYHVMTEKYLRQGMINHPTTGESIEPLFAVVEYDYESILQQLCEALGWQGGTIHQVIAEIKRLKAKEKE
jgi:hypothetical protein